MPCVPASALSSGGSDRSAWQIRPDKDTASSSNKLLGPARCQTKGLVRTRCAREEKVELPQGMQGLNANRTTGSISEVRNVGTVWKLPEHSQPAGHFDALPGLEPANLLPELAGLEPQPDTRLHL